MRVLTGTAKPMFSEPKLIAVLMPITSPCRLTSGPPELPKLIAASVWMKFSNELVSSLMLIRRCLALTTPTVTLLVSACGLPMAITQSPTRSASLSPSGSTGRSWASILSRARSVARSVPFTSAE